MAIDSSTTAFSLYSYLNTNTATVINTPGSATANQLQGIGDFNGDGIEDLGVLVNDYVDALGAHLPTAVLIYYGNPGGLVSSQKPNFALITGNSLPDQISTFAQAGDLNGDGYDDLLVSAPASNLYQGNIFVVLGGGVFLQPNPGNFPFILGSDITNNFVIAGLPDSDAGTSISGDTDVNGDGFDDVIVGAPGYSGNDNLSYVLFGSDFNNTVNQTGTIGDDVMLGTATGESFVAGQGDDQIFTNGGLDVVYAGPGDDLVTVSDTYFRRLDGGTGLDVLEFESYNGQAWDLTTLAPGVRLQDFEVLDIRNYGANTLTLNALTVTNLSSDNTLFVLMDEGDSLVLSADFKLGGTTYQYGDKYYQYTSDTSAAKVLVNQAKAPTYNALDTNKPASILPSASNPLSELFSESTIALTSTPAIINAPSGPTQLFVSNPTVSETAGVVNFAIQRSGDLSKYVLVGYQTQDGDGKAGNRYLPVAGRLLFAPGETTKTVTVSVPNSSIYSGDRQFGLLVSQLHEGLDPSTWPLALNVSGDANGEQIRRWSYVADSTENGLMSGRLEFSTTVTNGQAQINLSTREIGDFNEFFNYNPQTDQYESFLLNESTGATFTYLDSNLGDTPNGTKLALKDGDRGDADGVNNGLVKIQGYAGRTIPGLITNNNQTFWAPTRADGQVQWRLIDSPETNYELGWIPVDDQQGSVNGLKPNDAGYEAAALARKEVIFQNQVNASTQSLTRTLAQNSFLQPNTLVLTEKQFFGEFAFSNLEANRFHMLYSQQGTQTTFSVTDTPVIQSDSRGYHQLTFNGMTAEIGSNTLVVPGQLNQSIAVQTSLSRAAAYQNLIALYKVDSLTGGLDTNGDRQIDLQPGDLDYAKEALNRAKDPLTGVTLTTPENLESTQKEMTLLGANLYGMVMIPNANIDQVLTENPLNDANLGPVALFSFGQANPDGISHMARLGANLFGFEDILGGGDRDYNDMVLQVTFANV